MALLAELVWLIDIIIQCFGYFFLYCFFVSVVPLLFTLYSLCWVREKFTSLIYLGHELRLSGEDVIISMDKNAINSIINGVIFMKERFSVEEMRDLFLRNVINAKDDKNRPLFPKFTRHVTLRAGYMVWSEENNFSIDDHIRLFDGRRPRDDEELKALFGSICNTSFTRPGKPGWEILIIPLDFKQETDPKTCILFRIEHYIADGISIFRLIIEQMAGDHGAFTPVINSLGKKRISGYKNRILILLENVIRFSYALVNVPDALRRQMFHFDRNILHGPALSGTQIFDWTTAVNLNHVKDIKTVTCTTVNDVFMSCLAAALRKYFVKQNVCPPSTGVQVVFPINLHPADDRISMKNEISYVITRLPLEEMDCLQRLRTTKVLMDTLKRSPDVITNSWFFKHISVIPYSLVRYFINKYPASVIVSNVPGPHQKAFFNGTKIDSVMALAPNRGSTGVGVVIVSYAEEVTVSLTVDTALIGHREGVRSLLDGFVEEVQHLHHSVAIKKKLD